MEEEDVSLFPTNIFIRWKSKCTIKLQFYKAEMIEEEETVEQKSYIGRVETLRRKKLELGTSGSAGSTKYTKSKHKKSSHEDSSSDDDEDKENFKLDWRAKHLGILPLYFLKTQKRCYSSLIFS